MNNAWSTIVCRACYATAPAQSKPVSQLFSSLRRYPNGCATDGHSLFRAPGARGDKLFPIPAFARRGFSTTTSPKAKASRSRSPLKSPPKVLKTQPPPSKHEPKAVPKSQLQPAETLASHTEGVVESEPTELTWRDFSPEGGMPLPNGELEQSEINGIFGGEDLNRDTGNYVLSVMLWRRMSGALIDVGLDFPREMGISRIQALKGLEYVRSLDPAFDEQGAGEIWAYEEGERLRDTLRQRAVDLGLYKADKSEPLEEEESGQGTQYGREKSGESVLQTRRMEREAAWEKEQAEKKVRQEREEKAALQAARGPLELMAGVQPSVALTTGAEATGWLKPFERKEWVKYYEDHAMIIKENVVPQLHLAQRLGPALLFALLALGLCVYTSANYTPPPTSARIYPDTPPAVATLGGITASILAIFVLSRFPPLWRTSSKYFVIVPAFPYAFSVLGAAFRHDTISHLAPNLLMLWLFGISLHEEVGRGNFLAIFLGSSIIGGYSSLAYNVFRKQWTSYIHGSSGGVLGVVAASCYIRPEGSIHLFGYELPLAAWILVALFGAGELIAAIRMKKTTIDHAGHLGGLLSGLAAAAYLKRRSQTDINVMKDMPVEGTIGRTV